MTAELAEQGTFVEICDVICVFTSGCGHIIQTTSCHNKYNISKLGKAYKQGRGKIHLIPCDEVFCHQSAVLTTISPRSCKECAKPGDIPYVGFKSSVCSDATTVPLSPREVQRRRIEYEERDIKTKDRLRELSERFDPGDTVSISTYADPNAHVAIFEFIQRQRFYVWLAHKRHIENAMHSPLSSRAHFYGGRHDKSELLVSVGVADKGVAGEQCGICQDPDCLLVDADPRRLPCGHLFHYDCIWKWIDLHETDRYDEQTCPECRQRYYIIPLPWCREQYYITYPLPWHESCQWHWEDWDWRLLF